MRITARLCLGIVTLVAIMVLAACAAGTRAHARAQPHASAGPARPNIIVILADDAGYADFGFRGSREFRTPNIDALARAGTVFDAAYATTPFCSPSRAGLLTGRHPLRYGYEFNLTHKAPPGVDPAYMGLDKGVRTMADLLRAGGYRTIAIGKWHLGLQPQFHPNARGFDHFYGFLDGNSRYLPGKVRPGTLERNSTAVPPPDAYLTDDLGREAIAQVRASVSSGKPFFLYLAFNAPHTPMEALPRDEARFAGIADPQRRRLAAMTWAMDRAIGALLDDLRKTGADENTLIVFTNDNGGDRVGLDASNAPLRGTKGTLLEGGIRVPMVVRYPAGSGEIARAGQRVDRPVSLMDILPTALELAGVTVPANLDGRSLQSTQGRALFWRYDVAAAMRDGAWKLLRFPDRPAELYDLSADAGEARNLAAAEPKRVATMLKALFAWEATVEHPRWHTGSYWTQEDIRRYDDAHVAAGIAASKADLTKTPKD